MILKRMRIIEDLQAELNKMKEHYDEALENNKEFQVIKDEMSKIKEESKVKQEKILNNSSYKGLAEQLKEKRTEIKENKEVLSQELLDYYKETGSLEIEDEEGNVKKLKFSVRLSGSGAKE